MQRSHALDQIRRQECGCGEDHKLSLIFSVSGQDAEALSALRDSVDHLIGAYKASYAFKQPAHDPAVSIGPGQRSLLLWFARCEILDPSPRGGVARSGAIIVAAT